MNKHKINLYSRSHKSWDFINEKIKESVNHYPNILECLSISTPDKCITYQIDAVLYFEDFENPLDFVKAIREITDYFQEIDFRD